MYENDDYMREQTQCKKINALIIFLIIFAGYCWPDNAAGFPYQPKTHILIETEMSAVTDDPGKANMMSWLVSPEITDDGSTALSFRLNGSDQIICCLEIADGLIKINWKENYADQNMIQTDNLLIIPGSPVPCDVSPMPQSGWRDDSKVYEIKSTVAGRTFFDRLQVDCVDVDIEDAREKGWLKAGMGITKGLKLTTIINMRTHEVMDMQLWSVDDSWWIYDETRYRKSWRVK